MICRQWHGWTLPGQADDYEALLRTGILPGIQRIPGCRGAYLLRRAEEKEVEFVTLTFFESLEAVKAFAGAAYETAVVPPEARQLLSRYDEKARHYELIEKFD